MNPDLSVVIPTFRGADALVSLLPRLLDATRTYRTEIIIVDDGSPPADRDRIRAFAETRRDITVVWLPQNRGQQSATLAGLVAARGCAVVTIDDDGAHPPSVIPHMVAQLRHADLVYAAPRDEERNAIRRVGTALNNALFSLFLGKPLSVPVTSYRAIDSHLLACALRVPVNFAYLSAMLFSCRPRVRAVFYEPPTSDIKDRSRSRYTIGRLLRVFFYLVLYWGPLRSLGRVLKRPQPFEIREGCE